MASEPNYDVGLENILADPETVLLFREFLKDSFSSENLAFIIEVENFKDMWSQGADDASIKKRAHEIFDKYFNQQSKYELNVPGPLLEELKEKMKNPNTTIFNRVQQSIFKLVETDCYPRFIKSNLFRSHWPGFIWFPFFELSLTLELNKLKKNRKPKEAFEHIKKEKKNPLYSKLYAEVEGSRSDRRSTVAMLEEFFVSRGEISF